MKLTLSEKQIEAIVREEVTKLREGVSTTEEELEKNLDETSAIDDMLGMAASPPLQYDKPIETEPARGPLKLPIDIKFERNPKSGKVSGVRGSIDLAQLTEEQVETIVREEVAQLKKKKTIDLH